MQKDTFIKLADITTDMIGAFCPQLAVAKALLIGSKDLIFKEEIENLDPKKLEKMLENEKFVHLLLQVQDTCRRSKENEKARLFTKFFRTIVENGEFNKIESDEIEEFIYIFSSLSFREILVLHKIREFTLANKKNRTSENNIFIEDLGEWNKVNRFIINKLQVNNESISGFLSKLERTGLIIKNRNKKNGRNSYIDIQEGESSYGYISTSYFERSYALSDDIEDYLDECMKN